MPKKKKITDEIAVSIAPPEPRKRNPPRTAYSKESPSPNAWKPGISGNPSGGRKPDANRLLSKALSVQLRDRAPEAVTAACGLDKYSSWAQCLSMSLLLRATLKGDVGAASLIANLTELGSRAQLAIEQAMIDGPGKIEIVFVESDGDGRLKQADLEAGHFSPTLFQPPALPTSTAPVIDAVQPTEAELIEAESARLQAEECDESEPVPVTSKPKRNVSTSDKFTTALASITGQHQPSNYRPPQGCFRPRG